MPTPTPRPRTALVLSGGGARGAYQAGVLDGFASLGLFTSSQPPFDIIVGTSAGALNGGMMAAFADQPVEAARRLVDLWTSIEPSQVFRTDLRSLGAMSGRWIADLGFGGLTHRVAPKSLLDNAPLRDLLRDRLPVGRIGRLVDAGTLHAAVFSAVDLGTGEGVAFVQTRPDVPLWQRRRWSVERTSLELDHLLASAAIPVFFPSVPIGNRWFGDGSVRNTNPLSPAIHLGADRIVTIGVRSGTTATQPWRRYETAPSIAEIAGVLLDAVMLDAIEMDVAMAERVNASVMVCQSSHPDYPFRHVATGWMAPSKELSVIAAEHADRIPPMVRYLLRGLGDDAATTDLASYLLFDSAYCQKLVDLGRADAKTHAEHIGHLLEP
jgi:NTE family protein